MSEMNLTNFVHVMELKIFESHDFFFSSQGPNKTRYFERRYDILKMFIQSIRKKECNAGLEQFEVCLAV